MADWVSQGLPLARLLLAWISEQAENLRLVGEQEAVALDLKSTLRGPRDDPEVLHSWKLVLWRSHEGLGDEVSHAD
jgi:hypothetical protein